MALAWRLAQDDAGSLAVLEYLLDAGQDLVSPAIVEREARAALQQESAIDPLTGLINRFGFDVMVKCEVARCHRSRTPLSLLLISVDHLDGVTGRWGPPAGDRVLRRIAQAVRSAVRQTDLACRYAADEFAVIMPNVAALAARVAACRILAVVRAFRTTALMPGVPWEVTASLGVAELPRDDRMSAGQLVALAGRALQVVKDCGGGRLACELNR